MSEQMYHVDLPSSVTNLTGQDRRTKLTGLRANLVNMQPRQDAQGKPLRQVTVALAGSPEFPDEADVTFYGDQPVAKEIIERLGMQTFELIVAQLPESIASNPEKAAQAVLKLCTEVNDRLRKVTVDGQETETRRAETRTIPSNPHVFQTKTYGDGTGSLVREMYRKAKIRVLGA